MSTIAEIELAASEFALAHTLEAFPDTEFEVVRIAAHDRNHLMPYLRASKGDIDSLPNRLEDDSSVEAITIVDELEDEILFRMSWIEDIEAVLHMVLEQEASVVEMHGLNDTWYLRVLFPDRESLSATHEFCTDHGLTFTIRNIHDLERSVSRGEFGLTREQYEALVTAAEFGYFNVPREATMGDLADKLGVSQQALSERLRRGHKTLINGALRIDESKIEH